MECEKHPVKEGYPELEEVSRSLDKEDKVISRTYRCFCGREYTEAIE